MSDVELAVLCSTYRERWESIRKLGRTICDELSVDSEALIVRHDGKAYAVSPDVLASGCLHFREVRVPEEEEPISPSEAARMH